MTSPVTPTTQPKTQEVSIPLSYLDELEGVYRREYGELGLQRCAQRNGMRGAITGYDWGYLAIAAREEPAELADETTREVFLEDQAFTAYQLLAMIEREYEGYPMIVAACRAALGEVIGQ